MFLNVGEAARTFGGKRAVDLLIRLFYLNVLTPETVEGLLRFDYMIILNVFEGTLPKQKVVSERAVIIFDFFDPQPKFNADGFEETLLNRCVISQHFGKVFEQLFALN